MKKAQQWRKSSYSTQTDNCIELPRTLDAVRDSKNGAVLSLSEQSVQELLAAAKNH